MKVLIADDDSVNLRALEAAVQKWGYDTQTAQDGKEAYNQLMVDAPPRMAILDWMMPNLSGLKICQAVRNRVSRPYVYIILLTSRDSTHELIEGLDAGADDYLTKPYNFHELRARLSVGCRVLEVHKRLAYAREALAKHMQGLQGTIAVLNDPI